MNNQRRKRLKEVIDLINQANSIIEEVKDEEEEALNNLPENLQDTERAESMQECIDQLEEIYDDLTDRSTELEEF